MTAKQSSDFPPGTQVCINAGSYAGKTGTVVRQYRGRPLGMDRVMIELPNGAKGWAISVPVEYVEVAR